MASCPLAVVLQSLQMTPVLTGDKYPSWSKTTTTRTIRVCFGEYYHFRIIPEKAWTRAASPETLPLYVCWMTSHKTPTPVKPQALSLGIVWLHHPPGTSTFQENRDLALIDSQYPTQGQSVAKLAAQGAEQAAASHQVKVTVKGEGRVWSAQALFSQLVSVIFHVLAQSQNATTVQLGTAHLRDIDPVFLSSLLQHSPLCCLYLPDCSLETSSTREARGAVSDRLLTITNIKSSRKIAGIMECVGKGGKEKENREGTDQEPKKLKERKRYWKAHLDNKSREEIFREQNKIR